MLCGVLLKEMTITTFGDYFHCVILNCRPIELMSECFADDRAP
jgi:hypothetical protein